MKHDQFILKELLDLWFRDDPNGTPSYTNELLRYAENLIQLFIFGDPIIYAQKERAIPCLMLLQDAEIIDSTLSFNEAQKVGAKKAKGELNKLLNKNPEVKKIIDDMKKSFEELIDAQSHKPTEEDIERQREIMRKALIDNLCLN